MRKNVLFAAAAAALLSACGIGAPDYPEFTETSYRIEGSTAAADGGAAVQTVIYRSGPKMRVETVLPNYGRATIVFDESTSAAYVLNPTGQLPTATPSASAQPQAAPQAGSTTTTPQGATVTTTPPATAPAITAQAPATAQPVVGVAVRIEDADAPQPLETAWAALGAAKSPANAAPNGPRAKRLPLVSNAPPASPVTASCFASPKAAARFGKPLRCNAAIRTKRCLACHPAIN
jgi:hypothetical protein